MASLMVLVPGAAQTPPPADGAAGAAEASPDGAGPGETADGRPDAGAVRTPPACILRHIEASVSLDEPSSSMDVRARLSLEAGRNGSQVLLRLRSSMTVRSVAEEGGGGLSFWRPDWNFLNVSLGRELAAKTAFNLTVIYDGRVQNTPDGGGSYWDYIGPEGSWVRTYGDYFPSDENRSRATSRLWVTAPENRTVVSSGSLLSRTEDRANGTATTAWACDRPESGISFLAGNLTRSGYDLGGRRYDLYLRPDHAGAAPSYAAETARAAAFYLGQFGPAGFSNLSVAEVPGIYAAWGQSMPGMMWISSRNFDGPLPYRLLAHELAHQWWGIDVEGETPGENFLQEGFAGYSEAMYEREHYGNWGYLEYCRQQYISRFVDGPAEETALMGNDYELASFKGPWVLHMLRRLVGDGPFNRTLREFHGNFSGARADHFDFQKTLSGATGRDLSEFFAWWLYSTGRLDYAVLDAVVLRGHSGADRVQVSVESRGLLGGLPLDLGIYFEGGRRGLSPAAWDGSSASAVLECDVDYPVDAVRLDPLNWLLDVRPSNSEAPTRSGFFDLSADSLAVSPARPLENADFSVSAVLSFNSSEGPREVGASLLVDGTALRNLTVEVAPGGRAFANFTLDLPAGEHALAVAADPSGLLFETDEGNNRAFLRVSVEPLPDLLPEVGILPGGISVSPADTPGGRPAFLEVALVNSGPVAAPNVAVDVWVDSLETGYAGRSGGLSLGPSQAGRASLPWTAVAGWHQLTARVVLGQGQNDGDPSNDEATAQVYVNSPPTAVLTAPAGQHRPGEWVGLSGALSVDDGRVARYLFDFGDGADSGWTVDNATAHAYGARGTYQARLRVMDETGAESDWSAPAVVRVASLPPSAAIRAVRRTGDVLTPLSFSSVASDPDGSIVTLAWSFGDGGTASGPSVTHTWSRRGDFTVALSVVDDSGQGGSASVLVRIEDLPPAPVISFSGRIARVGERVAFWAGNSTDPDDPPSALSFVWDFGGGQKATGPEASYAFAGPGRHRVALTVSDGNLSAETWVELEVRPAPPAGPGAGAGPAPALGLGLVLASLAGLAAWLMLPSRTKKIEEEE